VRRASSFRDFGASPPGLFVGLRERERDTLTRTVTSCAIRANHPSFMVLFWRRFLRAAGEGKERQHQRRD
jgi:hypothetical protein